MKNRFLGTWKVDPDDHPSIEIYGNVAMEFKPKGKLKYIIDSEQRQQIAFLTYEIQGDNLITDQPSAPKIETTRFEFISDDRLKLFFDGVESNFIRSNEKANGWLRKLLSNLFTRRS